MLASLQVWQVLLVAAVGGSAVLVWVLHSLGVHSELSCISLAPLLFVWPQQAWGTAVFDHCDKFENRPPGQPGDNYTIKYRVNSACFDFFMVHATDSGSRQTNLPP